MAIGSIWQQARQPLPLAFDQGLDPVEASAQQGVVPRWVAAKSKQSSCAEADPVSLTSISRAVFRVTSFAWSEAAAASRVALMELTPRR